MNLKGVLPDKAVQVITEISSQLGQLKQQFSTLDAKALVTRSDGDRLYGSSAQRKELQVSGKTPLNITGLIGLLSQPQIANVNVQPGVPGAGPSAQPGTLVTINNIINQVISPGDVQPLSAIAVTLTDTHAHRVANYKPSSYAQGTIFLETDTLLLLENSGTLWQTIAGQISATHAARLSVWLSVQFSTGTPLYETNRTVRYEVRNASGTVTVSGGTSVAWASGDEFINTAGGFTAAQWPAGTPIVINGVSLHVSTVTSPTALILQAPTANGTFAYSVASGLWVYQQGTMSNQGSNVPTDLGDNDKGFRFFEDNLFFHQSQWTGAAWARGPEDLDRADTFHHIGSVPSEGGWHACNGSTTTYYDYTAPDTPISRILPDTDGTPAYEKGGPTYSETINPPTLPTVTTTVPAGGGVSVGTGTVQSGSGATVVTSVSGGGGGGGTNIPGVVTLPDDPIAYWKPINVYRR